MTAAPTYTYQALVWRIIDADTYEVEVDVGFRMSARLPLRLAHVDTPERYTDAGKAAIAHASALLGPLPRVVTVRTMKPADKYGRYLADLYIRDVSMAQHLLDAGMAVAYEGGTK
jgi:micrococcal nuclease